MRAVLAAIKKFKCEILVALFFILVRLPNLGHDTFNTDVWRWKARSYDFSTGIFTLDFAKTLQKYHPGVTLMWVGTVAIKVSNLVLKFNQEINTVDAIFLLHVIQKILVVLVQGISFAFVYYVLRKLFSSKFAVLATLLLCLEPFYVAITREFHLEGMLTIFMLVSSLWFYFYLQDRTNFNRLVVSAIFAGLSFLTKTTSLFLILFVGLICLIEIIKTSKIKTYILAYSKWLLISFFVFYLFWPALWVIPKQVFIELKSGIDVGVDVEHVQYYFGSLVSDPGPLYYLVVLNLRSSVYLIIGLLGLGLVAKRFTKEKKDFITYLFLYSLFYVLEISIPSKKLDRYIMPALASLVICSAFFWEYILDWFKANIGIKFVLFFFPLVVTLFLIHPDYFSYYNPMFGGLSTGIRVLEPKWLIGEPQILDYFKKLNAKQKFDYSDADDSFEELIYRDSNKNKRVLSVGFQEKYYTQIWPFFRQIGAWALIQDITPFAVHARYFVYPVWSDESVREDRFKIKYLDSIYVRGIPIYRVYERIF